MARTVWTGTLNFGLVTVPVGLYPATEDHTIHFHQLQRGTSDRIRYQRVNERTGREVDSKDIVKGYELAPGEYVVIEPEELDGISPGRSKTIDIVGFVDLDEVEPIYFDRTYYLGPRGEEYARVYALLRAALSESNRAGIATFTMRGKEYLAAVRAENDILALHTRCVTRRGRSTRFRATRPSNPRSWPRPASSSTHSVSSGTRRSTGTPSTSGCASSSRRNARARRLWSRRGRPWPPTSST
jgi:Ku protein